jgi:hypothetical protein
MAPMKRPGCAALTAALFGTSTGCASGGGSGASIVQVTPNAAFSDAPFSLTIYGAGFRPAYDVDIMGGSAGIDTGGFSAFLAPDPGGTLPRVAATGLVWQSTGQLVAQFPAGVAAGTYDVGVHDPRGQDTVKPLAFTSLGKDLMPPAINIQTPPAGSLYGAGAEVDVVFYADDGVGVVASLSWTAHTAEASFSGSCPVGGGGGPQICRFTFTAPSPPNGLEALFVDVAATDGAGNPASATLVLTLAPRPAVTAVSPTIGSTLGGEQIDVQGTNFITASGGDPGTELLVDGQPIFTTVLSPTHLVGMTAPHDAGDVPLSVSTGHAATPAGTFTFVAPAIVRLVTPASGPTPGGTPVIVVGDNFRPGGTTILFGGLPLVCPRFVSTSRIEGFAPAAAGAGAVGVAATDPVVDGNVLDNGFTYVAEADAGAPADAGCSGSGP